MTTATLKGLLGRKLRTGLTALAIVLGVAMVCGSFVLTDTMLKASKQLKTASYSGSDAVVTGRTAFSSDNNAGASVRAIPQTLVQKARAVPSVAVAQGELTDTAKLTKKNGKVLNSGGGPPFAIGFDMTSPAVQKLSPLQLKQGRYASAPSEVTLDANSAKKQHYKVGDTIGVIAIGPVRQFKITGITSFGGVSSLGGATIVQFSLAGAQQLFQKPGQIDTILVKGKPGVAKAQLQADLRKAMPPTTKVESAQKQDRFDFKGLDQFLKIIRIALIAFGGISLFVGAFIIFNTLSITVAQRAREFGLLRMIGASRKQVLRSVVLEAAVVGFIASVIGIAAGFGLAKLLNAIFKSSGIDLPQAGTVFAGRTVILSFVIGIGVTTVAGLGPALRATRVAPVEALREGTLTTVDRQSRVSLVIGIVAMLLGAFLVAYGLFGSGLGATGVLTSMGAGTLLMFVGVAVFSRRIARPLANALGWPLARIGGAAGRLARENAMRNPGRTATTAAALMIGLALVTFVAVLSSGMKHSFSSALDKQVNANYVVTSQDGYSPFQAGAEAALKQAGATRTTAVLNTDNGAKAFGKKTGVTGVDPATAGGLLKYDWKKGSSDAALASLDGNGTIVNDKYAKDHHLKVGSAFTIVTPTSGTRTLVVRGIQKPPAFDPLNLGQIEISAQTYQRLYPDHRVQYVFAQANAQKATLKSALAGFPDAKLKTRQGFVDDVNKQMDSFFNLLYVLLALSVIVSLFGIVNTLVLSVFERTRELGMLRAVGMTRRQVRRMIRSESIVTALIGAVLGIVVGIFLSALTTKALSQYGVAFSLPVGALIVFVIVAIVAGVLAAILPARRAARLNVLEALQYE